MVSVIRSIAKYMNKQTFHGMVPVTESEIIMAARFRMMQVFVRKGVNMCITDAKLEHLYLETKGMLHSIKCSLI